MGNSGLYVFPSHEEELTHNTAKLLQVNKKHPVAKLKAVGKGSHSSIRDSEHGGDLLLTVFISKDAQVMLIYNLHVEFGLFNGAIGKWSILYTKMAIVLQTAFLMQSWSSFTTTLVHLSSKKNLKLFQLFESPGK